MRADLATPHTRHIRSISRLLMAIAGVIFITEFVVMLILKLLPNLSTYQEAATDALILILLLLPTLYYLVYLPLRGQIDQLEATRGRLTASEKRFADIASHVGEWIWEVDAKGRFTYSSPMVSEMLGLRSEEVIGLHFYDFFLPEEREELKRAAFDIFAKKQSFRSFVSRNRHRDGRIVTLDCSALPVLDENGELIGYRGADRDITEQILAQERLLSAKSDAEASSRAKSTFLANMSHELRTPINGTLGILDLLRQGDLTPAQREQVETAFRTSSHLLEQIDQLLQYSQLETHQLVVHPQPFDPRELVEGIDAAMRPGAINKGLRFETACDSQLPARLLGDQGHIGAVLENLIDNAIKFTHRGGVRVEANYQAQPKGSGTLHLHVLDTGIGIPDTGIDKLFEEFTQLHDGPSRRYGGTGLGLTLCRRLVEGMGGKIGADRRFSGGTIFWVSLPLEEIVDAPAVSATHRPGA